MAGLVELEWLAAAALEFKLVQFIRSNYLDFQ
jgi:hypothetical protein